MKRIARKTHLNLYEVLQREQAATEVNIQQLETGGACKAKRKKVVHQGTVTARTTKEW